MEETPLGLDVDPPDLEFWPTVRRLARLWRPEWRNATVGIAAAFLTTALSLTITKLVQLAIDRAVVPDRPGRLPPLIALIAVLALLRFGTNGVRRLTTSRIGINSETRMRRMLFAAYLQYPRAFYDRHATGQVLSRATNDLYPVRYFIGWGVVQSIQSGMMIVGVSIVLLYVNPLLAFCAGIVMPLIAFLTWRFAHLVVPITRRVQQKVADVTETADEAVVGIEMVQAFGREDDIRSRFGGRSAAGARRHPRAGRRQRALPAGPDGAARVRDRDRAARRRPARDPRRPHDRRVRALQQPAPAARVAARGARLDPQPRAARDRLGLALVRVARGHPAAARAGAPARPAGRAARRPLRWRRCRHSRRWST